MGSHESPKTKLVRYLSDHPQWENYRDDDEMFIQELPKVELHVHLDGSFDPDFLWKFLQEHPDLLQCLPTGTPLPWENNRLLNVQAKIRQCRSSKDFHNLCTCRGYRSLAHMLTCFEIFLPLVRNNLELIERLAYDFCQRQYQQNIVYTEVRYSPFLLAEGFEISKADATSPDNVNIAGEQVFAAVTRGLRRGAAQFGIVVTQILCGITWKPHFANATLQLALLHRHSTPCQVVGVDIAAGEEHFDQATHPDLYQAHYDMMQGAQAHDLPITLHTGEVMPNTLSPCDNIARAVRQYGAKRIGHGYRLADAKSPADDDLIRDMRDRRIHIEVCPTSSDETGGWQYERKDWARHPVHVMLQQQQSISFHSDDPAVFHTSLAWQYRIVLQKMGLTRQQLLDSNFAAIDAAFCDDACKQDVRQKLEKFAHAFGMITSESDARNDQQAYPHSRSFRRSTSDTFADRVYVKRRNKKAEYM